MKQKRTKILLLLLMVNISSLIGQQNGFKGKLSNSFGYEDVYKLRKVTFWESAGFFGYQSWIQIMSDDDPNDPISSSSSTIAWENCNKVKRIAYVSNSKARVVAEFEISCSGGNASKYYGKATNDDGYDFPVRELTLSNGRYIYPKTDCDQKFDGKVVRITTINFYTLNK